MGEIKKDSDIEKSSRISISEGEIQEYHEEDRTGLKRSLSTRHIVMITLGNSIGMSLWLGTARQLQTGGPVGCWISWLIIVSVAICLVNASGELSVMYPVSAPFAQWADLFLDKAWAITVGFDYWLLFTLNFANELTAANTVVHYWTNADGMGEVMQTPSPLQSG